MRRKRLLVIAAGLASLALTLVPPMATSVAQASAVGGGGLTTAEAHLSLNLKRRSLFGLACVQDKLSGSSEAAHCSDWWWRILPEWHKRLLRRHMELLVCHS